MGKKSKRAPKKTEAAPQDRLGEAQALLAKGRWKEARERLRQFVDEEPEKLQLWGLLGIAYHNSEEYEKAIEAFEEVMRRADIPPAVICFQASISCEALNRHQKAVRYARMATELEPGSAQFHLHLGDPPQWATFVRGSGRIAPRGSEVRRR